MFFEEKIILFFSLSFFLNFDRFGKVWYNGIMKMRKGKKTKFVMGFIIFDTGAILWYNGCVR